MEITLSSKDNHHELLTDLPNDHSLHKTSSPKPPPSLLVRSVPIQPDCSSACRLGGKHSTILIQDPGYLAQQSMESLSQGLASFGQNVWIANLFHVIGSTSMEDLTPESLSTIMNQGPTFVSLPGASQPTPLRPLTLAHFPTTMPLEKIERKNTRSIEGEQQGTEGITCPTENPQNGCLHS
ncbi:hypothetical protein FXO37_11702 [Capsicum annuum]|nr:hypothetical protein FXO37_11702 [Capsicum annuum]